MRRLVALLATTARAQTPRRVHGFDVRTRAGHAFKCLDAFIAPAPWNASAPALIGICHPGHRQLTWAGGRCGFRYGSTAMDADVTREAGHEVFACAVPPSEQLDGKFLGARLTDGEHNVVSVTASTWPWRQRAKTYGVAVTFMGKRAARPWTTRPTSCTSMAATAAARPKARAASCTRRSGRRRPSRGSKRC